MYAFCGPVREPRNIPKYPRERYLVFWSDFRDSSGKADISIILWFVLIFCVLAIPLQRFFFSQ